MRYSTEAYFKSITLGGMIFIFALAPHASALTGQDIGSVGVAGSDSLSNGVYAVKGSGVDIWGNADSFRYVYQQMTGDGTIIARVASQTNTNSFARAGVMMRNGLNPTDVHVSTVVQAADPLALEYRFASGGTTGATLGSTIPAPYWVKLTRAGNVFTGYTSANGTTWSQLGTQTVTMNSIIDVGLLVCSHNNSALCTATFDNVQLPQVSSGTPIITPASVPSTNTELMPFGVCSSNEAQLAYATFLPKMAAAGVKWYRNFQEWSTMQPSSGGAINYSQMDSMVSTAKANGISTSGIFYYSTLWAASNSQAFPLRSLTTWKSYISSIVGHYNSPTNFITDWEVWNEPEVFNAGHNTAADYATLVVNAYAAAKSANPNAKVGLSIASLDVPYLNDVVGSLVAQGKGGNFDFICIHPYELLSRLDVPGGENYFLGSVGAIRAMLAAKDSSQANVPIWITEEGEEVGSQLDGPTAPTTVTESSAANAMVKSYAMGMALGIKHIDWYEAQDANASGFTYGWGLLRSDSSPRPAYTAMKALTTYLGATPQYLGWLDLNYDNTGYGFVYQGATTAVLAAWMPKGKTGSTSFTSNVTVVNLQANTTWILSAGTALTLTNTPLLVVGLPSALVSTAESHAGHPFPWGSTGSLTTANVKLGSTNSNAGLEQDRGFTTVPYTFSDGSTGVKVHASTQADSDNTYFSVQPSFANYNPHTLYVRVTARRISSDASGVGMNLYYESVTGSTAGSALYPYVNKGAWFNLPSYDNTHWYTYVWTLTDAGFSHTYGYDLFFRFDNSEPFVIGKVEASTNSSFH